MCGCFGAVYQEQRTGSCRGRRLLSFYQLCLLTLIGLQFYTTVYMLNTAESLQTVKDELASARSNETVAYVDAEESLSNKVQPALLLLLRLLCSPHFIAPFPCSSTTTTSTR
mmetsp:Transcript_30861/g.53001  ORF Transcript_30861/g.53001 Transcript_30861/m.53001 type:complete len:112 (+) Transcript_30861:439-774(+)